jgi:hypothetical protein
MTRPKRAKTKRSKGIGVKKDPNLDSDIAYPSVALYADLSPFEKRERMALSQALLGLLQYWRGDPRMSHWEEYFYTSMVRIIQEYHGAAKITPKQLNKIQQIAEKLRTSPEIDLEEDVDPEDLYYKNLDNGLY